MSLVVIFDKIENSTNTVTSTFEIPLEEIDYYDTLKDNFNFVVNELEKIEERMTSMEKEKPDIVDKVKRTDESPNVPAKQRNFVVTFPEEVDALSTKIKFPDYQTAYPHLDDLFEEQEEKKP